jgi:hypothetical protein
MSHVDNVILSFSILEKSQCHEDGSRTWLIMEDVNAWLLKEIAQRFGPDIGGLADAYGGSKWLETPLFVAAFNYLPEAELLGLLRTLPWEEPAEVQLMVKRQEGELFEMIQPCLTE